ncbi:MAG: type II/IV secretion system protein, partial [Deltaproteobacteria bacterium]|nr:type II/IV secretion system protein [Deltaproteobacteria bacterium]
MSTNRLNLTARDYTVAWLLNLLHTQGLISPKQEQDVIRQERVLREKTLRRRVDDVRSRQGAVAAASPVEIVEAAALTGLDGRPLNEDRLMEIFAAEVGMRFVRIDPLKLNERLITSTMSRPFAKRHVCVPIAKMENGRVVVAVDNPFELDLQEALRGLLPGGFEVVLASRSTLLTTINDVYGFRSAVNAAERSFGVTTDLGNLEQLVKLTVTGDEVEASDRHVVNAVEFLLKYAFEQRASDIHIEPKRDESQIRLRIDGILHPIYRLPRVVHTAVVSRIKTLARMDIAERRRPQDGRLKTELQGRETELRVSTLPVAFGEKVVIRIFDPQTLLLDLEGLGFFETELNAYKSFLRHTTGLILVTGQTGSGKTTTLYSTLKLLSGPDVNITTVEDPIEMVYEPFNQTLVQPKIDVTFANALRTVLRQDPDIIMVGEIRDADTAKIAVQAALTGHMVFSTLHTNDAPGAITRLYNLGVEPYLISASLAGVLGQRLVRRL